MWVLLAFGSALFAGVTSVLAKCGIRQTDSTLATALRTVVVLAFSWLMVFITGAQANLAGVSPRSWAFLVLSGLATGASWLCYFRALQLGDINKVTPIDKSSTVLTMLLAMLFLGEGATPLKALAMVMIAGGTYLMVRKKHAEPAASAGRGGWLLYALGAALFASLTAILGKLGIENVNAHLGTAIRTGVVLAMAWGMVLISGKAHKIKQIDRRSWAFLLLSGVATGASWLCYFHALQLGPASVVAPIDKLSILVSIGFSALVLNEKLTRAAALGLGLIVAGTLALLL